MSIKFKTIWKAIRPFLTLGLSLLAVGIAKKNTPESTALSQTTEQVGDALLDAVDESISNSDSSTK